MSTSPCPMTERVVTAAGSRGDPTLGEHVAGCRSCQDAVLVSAALCEAASDDSPLPNPRVLWLRARREAQVLAARRVTRVIGLVETVAATLLAAGLVVVMIALGPAFLRAVADSSLHFAAVPALFGVPVLLAAGCVALLLPPLVSLADRVSR